MKCFYEHTYCHFLHYLNNPITDDAVIFTSSISFQYNSIDGRYTEFIGNSISTVFITAKRDHEFLVSKGRNKPNMSSSSINFGPH